MKQRTSTTLKLRSSDRSSNNGSSGLTTMRSRKRSPLQVFQSGSVNGFYPNVSSEPDLDSDVRNVRPSRSQAKTTTSRNPKKLASGRPLTRIPDRVNPLSLRRKSKRNRSLSCLSRTMLKTNDSFLQLHLEK